MNQKQEVALHLFELIEDTNTIFKSYSEIYSSALFEVLRDSDYEQRDVGYEEDYEEIILKNKDKVYKLFTDNRIILTPAEYREHFKDEQLEDYNLKNISDETLEMYLAYLYYEEILYSYVVTKLNALQHEYKDINLDHITYKTLVGKYTDNYFYESSKCW